MKVGLLLIGFIALMGVVLAIGLAVTFGELIRGFLQAMPR